MYTILAAKNITYKADGSINTKFDVGTYQYANSNHAVSGIENLATGYAPQAFDLEHTSFNRTSEIELNGQRMIFSYGPDKQRNVSRYYASAGATVPQTTRYYNGTYEKEITGSTTKEYDYIYNPEGLAAIAVKTGGTRSLFYTHTDHLGSLRTVTGADKTIKAQYSYDAWGVRTPESTNTMSFTRGFTGHEHLDDFNLINMNARMYDPALGRFLSVDPYVQMPDYTQSFNRYSYALNNPLIYTDPSGEFFFAAAGVGIFLNAACWGAAIGAATYTASVAFSDGGFNNWNWGNFGKSIGIGALSGAVTAGIGQMFGPVGSAGFGGELARAFTHGFANGMISGFTGGDFMQGFASGGLGSLAGSAFMMYGGKFANTAIGTYAFSGLAGGVGAELTGGNFWQGAGIGLMTAGLNHLQSVVDEAGARYYANKKAAYKDMWDNSFANGVPIREVSAWELENGNMIMLPYDKNTLRDSHNDALPISKMNSKGVRYVQYKGKWYAISGHAHTHPTIDTNLGLRNSDIQMFDFLNGSRVHNKIPLTILYNKTIYSSIYNTRTKMWNSVNKGTW